MKLNLVTFIIILLFLFGCGNSDLGFSNKLSASSLQTWELPDADKADPAPNKLTVQVEPTATFDPNSEKINYSYVLKNSSNSQQLAKSFLILLDPINPFSLENIYFPEHWDCLIFNQSYYPIHILHLISIDFQPPYDKPIYGIKPGQTLSGFGFTSNGLPEIGNFYIEGWVRAVWKEESEDENLPLQPSFPDNFFKIQTVIPISAPPPNF